MLFLCDMSCPALNNIYFFLSSLYTSVFYCMGAANADHWTPTSDLLTTKTEPKCYAKRNALLKVVLGSCRLVGIGLCLCQLILYLAKTSRSSVRTREARARGCQSISLQDSETKRTARCVFVPSRSSVHILYKYVQFLRHHGLTCSLSLKLSVSCSRLKFQYFVH